MQKQFKQYLIFLIFILIAPLTPSFALADAGIPLVAIFLNVDFVYLLIALIAVILIETVILKIILKTNYNKALIYSLSANIISTIAGVIIYGGFWYLPMVFGNRVATTILLPFLYLVWIPPNASVAYIITQILISLAITFLLSVYIEYFTLKSFLRNFDKKLVKKGAWIANLISYIFLTAVIFVALFYQFQIQANKQKAIKLEQQTKTEAKVDFLNPDNWQTYRNTQYNFEFKYPKDFLTEEPKTSSCPSSINIAGDRVCPYINATTGNFMAWNTVSDGDIYMVKKDDINNVFFCQSFGLKDSVIFAAKPENGNCFVMSLKIKNSTDCYKLQNTCQRTDTECFGAFERTRANCWDGIDSRDQVIKKLSDTFKFTK